jgi:hypothetical protein
MLIVLAGSLSGCYPILSNVQQYEIDVRDRWYAQRAWSRVCRDHEHQEYRWHFRDGFKAGYRAGASDPDACPPSVPPQKYWSVRYQNPVGRAKVQAWFEGYSYGIIESHVDGVHYYSQIPTQGPIQQDAPQNQENGVWLNDSSAPAGSREPHPLPVPEPGPDLPYESVYRQPAPYQQGIPVTGNVLPHSGYRYPGEVQAQRAGWSQTSPAHTARPPQAPPAQAAESEWRHPAPLHFPQTASPHHSTHPQHHSGR